MEISVTPAEFLCRETNKTAVRSDCGKSPAKAEAVGEEDISAFCAKFLAIEILSEHDVADCRLYRRNNCIGCIPARAADVPAAGIDVFLQQSVFARIILFHPRIFYCAFEVEHIVGILLKKLEVLIDCVPDILFDSSLDIPVPLSVEMRVGHKISLGLFCLSVIGSIRTCGSCK